MTIISAIHAVVYISFHSGSNLSSNIDLALLLLTDVRAVMRGELVATDTQKGESTGDNNNKIYKE